MASTDNGKQVITFRYQQEGTAEGFNKLLNGVIPTGVISGGDLVRIDNSTVEISPMQMMIGDGNVIVHVQTTEGARVNVTLGKPYVIATFNWANLVNNYVSFGASSLVDIPSNGNAIILGKCEFIGEEMGSQFDYTRKTWSSSYLNNDFLFNNKYNTKSSSFNVTSLDNEAELGFNVGAGSAIIQGKEVVINDDFKVVLSNDSSHTSSFDYINTSISNGRIDIAVLMNDGSVRYIMGEDKVNPIPPKYPSYGLVLAKFTYPASPISKILGHQITNIYNNNYMGFSPSVGESKASGISNAHTLYI